MGCEGSIEQRRDQKQKKRRTQTFHQRNPGEAFWGNDDISQLYQNSHGHLQLVQAHITLNLVPASHHANPHEYLEYFANQGAGRVIQDHQVPNRTCEQNPHNDNEEEGEESQSHGDTVPGEECAEESEDSIASIQPHYIMSTISEHCPLPPLKFTLVYE